MEMYHTKEVFAPGRPSQRWMKAEKHHRGKPFRKEGRQGGHGKNLVNWHIGVTSFPASLCMPIIWLLMQVTNGNSYLECKIAKNQCSNFDFSVKIICMYYLQLCEKYEISE